MPPRVTINLIRQLPPAGLRQRARSGNLAASGGEFPAKEGTQEATQGDGLQATIPLKEQAAEELNCIILNNSATIPKC
ncbi:hypothetical protein ZIOFF_061263 [Zingiber officinale]|uniref:Uncharacterized protein n=1 Tax=Zingiber officinale TaxID=94328 RepID=A0A8J5EZC8_ZINOF|nr:hypothetical protein ZIOFF_061263 [Zingiber officinale]